MKKRKKFSQMLQQAVQQIIEMYAKNNLASLGRLHSNALMKSHSLTGLKLQPLSEIENSLQKLIAKKKKGSTQKSQSKQNTPQNEKSAQRRTSIGNQKKNVYLSKLQEKPKQLLFQRNTKKHVPQFSEHINSIVSSYDGSLVKNPSQLSIQSRVLTESGTSSCTGSEYQLPIKSQFSQKCVKFSDKHIEINMSRMNQNKFFTNQEDRVRTPSILKKRLSNTNSVNSQRSSSIRSSAKISRAKDLIDMENLNADKVIKAKYEALIKKYEDLNKKFGKNLIKNYQKLQKFTDDIFPPQNTSIFSYSIHNKTENPNKNISWKRIPELYNDVENLIIVREQQSKSLIKITKRAAKNEASQAEEYFVTTLNCIRENKKVLNKIFEIGEMKLYGVYLVRIFSENRWKYVIIDDLIPVIYDERRKNYVPAFINVQKAEGNNSETIEIWPYLLEKAFAAYYSKYMALKYGTETDLLAEFTGVPYRTYKTNEIYFQNKQYLDIETLLKEERAILLGEKILDDKSTFYCILPDLNSITKKSQGFCTILSNQKGYKPTKQKLQLFLATLSNIYIYELDIQPNIHISYLCAQSRKSQASFKYRPTTVHTSQVKEYSEVMLRCFTIPEMTKAVLSIIQKDCKFYFQGKVQYKYIWIRAILLLKELNGDFRWIDGQYTNNKHLTFFLKLQPGEYYLLLMPEWNSSYKYDATISFFTECSSVAIEKRPYLPNQLIFEKGCADIAQRQGTMNQINNYICTYNYISEKTGLVIENINNQRENGPVTVMRSINALKSQVKLVPVNMEFYTIPNSDYDTETVKKMRKTIEVDIEANQNFTVVLKTVGGIDKKFFESFDFGS